MHFTTALTALLFTSVLATDHNSAYGMGGMGGGWSSSSAAAAPSGVSVPPKLAAAAGEKIVQIVTVGDNNGTLRYFPEDIVAEPGSIVQFQFYPKNHTITESSFADPCKPIAANLTSATRPGTKSGFVPVTGTEEFRPVFNMLINDTKPMWIFCGQQPHCIKGMSMVINQNRSDTEKTLENYKKKAALIPIPNANTSSVQATVASTAATAKSTAVFGAGTTAVVGTSTAAVATATQAAPPVAATSASGPSLSATGTTAVAPAIFTGMANRQGKDLAGLTGLGGLFVAGLAALL